MPFEMPSPKDESNCIVLMHVWPAQGLQESMIQIACAQFRGYYISFHFSFLFRFFFFFPFQFVQLKVKNLSTHWGAALCVMYIDLNELYVQ